MLICMGKQLHGRPGIAQFQSLVDQSVDTDGFLNLDPWPHGQGDECKKPISYFDIWSMISVGWILTRAI